MSLDFHVGSQWFNVTHNCKRHANALGVGALLWECQTLNGDRLTRAADFVPGVARALAELTLNPDAFRQFDAANGWGSVESFRGFLAEVLVALLADPDAEVRACR